MKYINLFEAYTDSIAIYLFNSMLYIDFIK